MEVVVLVVVEGIRTSSGTKADRRTLPYIDNGDRFVLIVSNNPLSYSISPSEGYRTR